jgi:hypothetical protein
VIFIEGPGRISSSIISRTMAVSPLRRRGEP